MLDLAVLANQCAPDIAPQVLERLMKVESSFNPYAIGVVGGRLARQPRHKEEAIATAQYLAQAGWNFSLGLGQVNRHNLDKYGLDYETVFDPCHNARAAAGIFNQCLRRASVKFSAQQAQLAAFSCYYSGNFRRGFLPRRADTDQLRRPDHGGETDADSWQCRAHCGDSGWAIPANGESPRRKRKPANDAWSQAIPGRRRFIPSRGESSAG
ncbi:type IV secretion system lytic transglycosylase VirB1 [Raoultella planticola]|uniref:Type IV secretion system lytic transglycosylase VirB1 n=1 Tax=Raoultella planticola TaxID=575 RepID=A0A485A6Z7_RAOPL|nr:type IV secretion system lytic transglycosylase VirB1 [Raoultella planticola]